jgi:hypothetical protein
VIAMRWAVVLLTLLALGTGDPQAQDGLEPVRELYAAADYEGALAALDRLPTATAPHDAVARDRLRAMALIALGRATAADDVIERIVTAAPLDPLGEEDAAPRIRLAFNTVRRRVLPMVARTRYNQAKAAFDRGQMPEAADGFANALTIIEALPDDAPGRDDLRTLAAGFLELARATRVRDAAPSDPAPEQPSASADPAGATDDRPPTPADAGRDAVPPAPADATTDRAVPPPPAEATASSTDSAEITEAVAISQELPPWQPVRTEQRQVTFSGILEVDIDEQGAVTAARMVDTAHPAYDAVLLATAMRWRYAPARRAGVPVASSKRIAIALRPQ